MASITGILKGVYYALKILHSLLWAIISLRWHIWRTKKSFAEELEEQGIPKDVARELTTQYNKENKELFGNLISTARVVSEVRKKKGKGSLNS